MRLLNTRTLQPLEFFGRDIPSYAILSHTWEEEEVALNELQDSACKTKLGFRKIRQFCKQALLQGFQWCWVDTCCIDKRSSAELSEAINSMFIWYQQAGLCLAYLSDVEPMDSNPSSSFQDNGLETFQSALRSSRWFTRGWTLQELIAPQKVIFLARDWTHIGTRETMSELLSDITGIDEPILKGHGFHDASIAKRMSWASSRETTRFEDLAYCLFGIFGVNMALLYGEGERAFLRLREEIMKTSDDESIFAWSANRSLTGESIEPLWTGLLARSPADFAKYGNVVPLSGPKSREPYSMTNEGLRIQLGLIVDKDDPHSYVA